MLRKKWIVAFLIVTFLVSVFYYYGRSIWVPVTKKMFGRETLESVYNHYGSKAETRLIPYFKKAGIKYPPKEIKLLAMKRERILELWARNNGQFKKIKEFRIRAASGGEGPKLREGDKQVPEGKYTIVALNPNSNYHLSMKLNYPNKFDSVHAKNEGRRYPGTNIFIHGKALSIGCLAMGDVSIEELFTLVYKIGIKRVSVIIAPYDPRKKSLVIQGDAPEWLPDLYKQISKEFNKH